MTLQDLLNKGFKVVGETVEDVRFKVLESELFILIYDDITRQVVYGCQKECFPRELYLIRYYEKK